MKRVLMVCEAFGGGVFTYVSQLCNDMCEEFDVYLAYTKRFDYDIQAREKLRSEMGISDSYVVGVVGRLAEQKKPVLCVRHIC